MPHSQVGQRCRQLQVSCQSSSSLKWAITTCLVFLVAWFDPMTATSKLSILIRTTVLIGSIYVLLSVNITRMSSARSSRSCRYHLVKFTAYCFDLQPNRCNSFPERTWWSCAHYQISFPFQQPSQCVEWHRRFVLLVSDTGSIDNERQSAIIWWWPTSLHSYALMDSVLKIPSLENTHVPSSSQEYHLSWHLMELLWVILLSIVALAWNAF